jgi:hypothetical protein
MGPENAGTTRVAVFELLARSQESQVLFVACDSRGREQARGAVASMGSADGAEGGFGSIHEIRAIATVDMEIDEPRGQKPAFEVDPRFADRFPGINSGNPTVGHCHACVGEQAIFENGRAAEKMKIPHDFPLFGRVRDRSCGEQSHAFTRLFHSTFATVNKIRQGCLLHAPDLSTTNTNEAIC